MMILRWLRDEMEMRGQMQDHDSFLNSIIFNLKNKDPS